MSALELVDLLPQLGDLTVAAAERWVAAALAQATALREHDPWLYPIEPERQQAAERLHAAWKHWADDVEALVRRAEPLQPVRGLEDLRQALGRVQALFKLTPAMIAQRRQQAAPGKVYSVEEARRELQLRDRG